MSDTEVTIEQADPKHLIRESFRIEGITAEECRSIFVDWALSLPVDVEPDRAARVLLDLYAPKVSATGEAAHPMLKNLLEGAARPSDQSPRRRGGRAARFSE